ncbi:MAG: hypothetical protein AABZ32_00425 [Bacteroidota bacterium]
MKKILVITCLFVLFCENLFAQKITSDSTKANAEIIKLHMEKCMCCWGWEIKMNNDSIIRSGDSKIGNTIGYSAVKNPIPVYIELGEQEKDCSKYYRIKKIKKIL